MSDKIVPNTTVHHNYSEISSPATDSSFTEKPQLWPMDRKLCDKQLPSAATDSNLNNKMSLKEGHSNMTSADTMSITKCCANDSLLTQRPGLGIKETDKVESFKLNPNAKSFVCASSKKLSTEKNRSVTDDSEMDYEFSRRNCQVNDTPDNLPEKDTKMKSSKNDSSFSLSSSSSRKSTDYSNDTDMSSDLPLSLERSNTEPLKKKPFQLNPEAKEFSIRGYSTSHTESFTVKKKEFLEMKLEEKRKHYKCRKYVELDEIPNWSEFSIKNNYMLHKLKLTEKEEAAVGNNSYKLDKELNDKVSIFVGDITTLEVDAIVNAANTQLFAGGGVCGAIYRGAGNILDKETISLAPCQTGDAKISGGYSLPARYVIHAVGPIGEIPSELESCYKRIVEVAIENDVKTIAIPCISTGIFGYPNKNAAMLAMQTIREMLEKHKDSITRIIFVLFMDVDIKLYKKYMQHFFPSDQKTSPSKKSEEPELESN